MKMTNLRLLAEMPDIPTTIGFEFGRYISLERLIEENKERYYETLEQGFQGWHQGKHDP